MQKYSSVLVYGDSLMKGVVLSDTRQYVTAKNACVASVQKTCPVPLYNKSSFGMTAKKAYERYFSEGNPLFADSAVGICYGGNDCNHDWAQISADPMQEYLPVTPLDEYEAIIEEIFACIRKSGGTPFVATLPPVHAARFLQWITRDGLSKESILQWLGDEQMIYRWQERYNNVLLQAALKNGITVLDLREPFLRTRHYESLLCEDGMHPNEQGQALMGAEMQRFMQENESKLFH